MEIDVVAALSNSGELRNGRGVGATAEERGELAGAIAPVKPGLKWLQVAVEGCPDDQGVQFGRFGTADISQERRIRLRDGWDCSGLMMVAYRAAGITIPRGSVAQSTVGLPVYDTNQLRPGDLLFIPGSDGTVTAPGHVGMYLGQRLLIEAPHSGLRVQLSPIAGYWREPRLDPSPAQLLLNQIQPHTEPVRFRS